MQPAPTPLLDQLPQPLMRAWRALSGRDTAPRPSASKPDTEAAKRLLDTVQHDIVGNRAALRTPYGERPLIYADYTASGRSVGFIEDNIRNKVLPYYANTHTEASFTGAQTNALREAARAAIRQSVNGSTSDKIIFCGSGATAAINKLIDILGLRMPRELDRRYQLAAAIPEAERPVIFVGPYEHHSNELPWRETIADVIRIGLDINGHIDQAQLALALDTYSDRPLRIGSFSAASNVTGLRSDVVGITRLLKQSGALSFWDYAAAGPYVAIDMNCPHGAIDAAFISPHKFVGGPGTPGVLVVKEQLMTNAVPAVVGGGTVSYVSPTEHRYLKDPEHREEGGTPAIVESIRAGLVFALKDQIGIDLIDAREHALVAQALEHFAAIPEIEVLGPATPERLGIFSLRIKHAGKDLHHGFVAALLNDLFGIQARGGCSCAGPYGHDLLNINSDRSRALDKVVADGYECFKPGWVRVNFHYAVESAEINYILAALKLVAEHGARLMASYALDRQKGAWTHRDGVSALPIVLTDLLNPGCESSDTVCSLSLDDILAETEGVMRSGAPAEHIAAAKTEQRFPPALEAHRWFAVATDSV
ncbi:aminotransferase class V-fold PLP-dependent enzyme [Congregibacter litoralis]|uniref:Selenocysteine lyase n=1 Tax=Congregibacter litoralis KT71 TaxID=314285 RepID=A4A4I5_9GAMM|nr:aminotransferase class V-fold PLP-dependent enzyme [Congregibacter litoralis]EAQ98706.1 Selenocysteine lyase [Congregibacter litoralis KT71]